MGSAGRVTGQILHVPSFLCLGGITALQATGWEAELMPRALYLISWQYFGLVWDAAWAGLGLHRETPVWTQNRPVKTFSGKTELFLHRSLTCWSEKQQPARGDRPYYHSGVHRLKVGWKMQLPSLAHLCPALFMDYFYLNRTVNVIYCSDESLVSLLRRGEERLWGEAEKRWQGWGNQSGLTGTWHLPLLLQ